MKNIKRLFRFAKKHLHLTFISIFMIIIVQILGFLSPLLVKQVLDDCLMGIEYDWVQVETNGVKVVTYHNNYYKQTRDLTKEDHIIGEAEIVIYKNGYYFVNTRLEEGNKTIEDDTLIYNDGTNIKYYPVTLLSAKEVTSFYQPITYILIIILILIGIKTIMTILCSYIQQISTNRMVNNLARMGRTEAMKACERLPISEFEKEPAGKMASRITNDVDGLIIMYRLLINVFLNAILSFIFAYVGMFYLNVKLALLSFAIYPLAAIWVFIYLKYLKKIVVKVNETRSLLVAKINEIINGIQILQIFNYKKPTIDEYDIINNEYKDEQLKEVKLHITAGWNLINIIKLLITALIVVYFGLQSTSIGGIIVTAGLIYAYNEYLLKIVEPINILFNQIGPFQHANVQIERIFKLIEGDLEDDYKEEIPRFKGDVKFDNIWFSYNIDNETSYVLKGVSFQAKAGQMLGLVGHTGSGKSSLMSLLLRFYDITDPLSGHIYVDGENIEKYSKRTYREHLGIVLQEPVLFKGTIASNIRFGKDGVSDEEIEKVLDQMGGNNIIKKFPQGINQPISRAGSNMSSGEKQIIALARVIIHDPSILIMDEATSHIDVETEEIIKNALNIICQKRTVIVIAHRLSTIYNADNIVVLDHGLKVEEGTHKELIKLNGTYANIYRAQIANINQ